VSSRPTLIDVAKAADVHASTASRALNPETRGVVSDTTVSRVLAAAKELGYRPHPLARGLRTDKTLTVGIVVPDLENPLFPPLVRGAEAALGAEGYTLLIGNTDNEQEHTEAVISTLVDRRVDGLILATAELGSGVAAAVQAEGIHVVLVNRESTDGSVSAIIGDDDLGIGMAVDHLVELGHTAIGHVAGPSLLSTGLGRCEAFRAHMERHGLPLEGRVEAAEWFQVAPGARATSALLSRNPELTAIVAGNDLLALGALRALHDAEFSVPGDISLTGYNDMPFVDLVQPPLTTVRLPYREMGSMAAQALLAGMRGDGDGPQVTRLRPTLRVRASTARPR
jgi:LacI family transcriptional regulator